MMSCQSAKAQAVYSEPSAPATPIESELIEMAQSISQVLRRIDDLEQSISPILRQDPPPDGVGKALESASVCEMQTRLRNLNRDLTLAVSRLGSVHSRVQL